MHNLKEIRENLEHFKTSLSHRNSEVDYEQILDLDKKNRQLIQEKEKFEMEKKNISKSKDESLFEKSDIYYTFFNELIKFIALSYISFSF